MSTNTSTDEPPNEPTARQTVVLYGNSLVVSSFGASLQGLPSLRVVSIDCTLPGAVQRLWALKPDIVLFDLATVHPDFAISLWNVYPALLLIGVDLGRGEILALSGNRERVLNVTELVQIIRGRTKTGAGEPT